MSPETPLVGVTTYYVEAAWGPWRSPAAVVPAPYFEMVAEAGGRPMLLPPSRSAPGAAGSGTGVADIAGSRTGAVGVVSALDALVLVGGGDVDPAAYGAPHHPAVAGVDAVRDRSELALLEAALDRDVPVLAICRGLQLLNVHLGGTLYTHLPDVIGHDGHQPGPGRFSEVEVATVPGTRTAGILGEQVTARCSHHQSVDRLGRGLVVTALSKGDAEKVVEAVELPTHRWVLGVQWHPEESGDRRLFDALVAAAR